MSGIPLEKKKGGQCEAKLPNYGLLCYVYFALQRYGKITTLATLYCLFVNHNYFTLINLMPFLSLRS